MNLFKWLGPKKFYKISGQTNEKIMAEWQNINSLLQGGEPSQLKQALISADKTLDNVLKDTCEGETMGERLKNAKDRFDDITYNKIWQAHKMRNSLVHESGFEPSLSLLRESVRDLKESLYILGVRIR